MGRDKTGRKQPVCCLQLLSGACSSLSEETCRCFQEISQHLNLRCDCATWAPVMWSHDPGKVLSVSFNRRSDLWTHLVFNWWIHPLGMVRGSFSFDSPILLRLVFPVYHWNAPLRRPNIQTQRPQWCGYACSSLLITPTRDESLCQSRERKQ